MKPNWKYILIFLILAFGISTPVHLGFIDPFFKKLSSDWIFSEWVYLAAGLGPFVAALIMLAIQKNLSNKITVLGMDRLKNVLIAILPVISFSVVGMENDLGINLHFFGFLFALVNVIYAFTEEFGWRRYLQNALEGLNKHWKYILIGFVWWIWHMRFETQFDLFIFPFICIGGAYLLGVLTDKTKTILPAVMMHTLIILLTNSGAITERKLAGIGFAIVAWIIIEQIWKKRAIGKAH